VFGGGLAPIVATALVERFHSSQAIAVYLFAMCVVSFLSTALLARRSGAARNRART
jgi:MHS family shikimate/dehydroshikimate transporter-like MFS transporter